MSLLKLHPPLLGFEQVEENGLGGGGIDTENSVCSFSLICPGKHDFAPQ